MTITQSQYPFLDLMWTMLVFFGWLIWFWMLIVIFGDLFHRSDISGWGKAGWTVVLILLPFIGVLTYLIVQGKNMGGRRQSRQDAAERGVAEQIAAAKLLLDNGAIDYEEYQELKRKALLG